MVNIEKNKIEDVVKTTKTEKPAFEYGMSLKMKVESIKEYNLTDESGKYLDDGKGGFLTKDYEFQFSVSIKNLKNGKDEMKKVKLNRKMTEAKLDSVFNKNIELINVNEIVIQAEGGFNSIYYNATNFKIISEDIYYELNKTISGFLITNIAETNTHKETNEKSVVIQCKYQKGRAMIIKDVKLRGIVRESVLDLLNKKVDLKNLNISKIGFNTYTNTTTKPVLSK
jgi:hypothetical protein